MKKILIALLISISFVANAFGQAVTNNLVGLGMSSELATYIASIIPGGSVLTNNSYLKSRNAANSADISLLKADGSDDTILNSDASDVIKHQIGGDANRIFTWDAASDAALSMTFGDAGTTATQILTFSGSTSDADDDSTLILAGGGGSGATRGAAITLPGEEVSGGSDITYSVGAGDTHKFNVNGGTEITIGDDFVVASGATTLWDLATSTASLSINNNTEAVLSNDALTFTGASFSFIPGATSLLFRNNANAETNLSITDAGVVTARAGLVATAGGITATAGDIVASASGATLRLQEATAGTKCMGSVTANGTTAVTTATTCALTASRIFISRTSLPSGTAQCAVTAIVNATSFDIDCDGAETGTFNWFIINEAA